MKIQIQVLLNLMTPQIQKNQMIKVIRIYKSMPQKVLRAITKVAQIKYYLANMLNTCICAIMMVKIE